MEWSSYMNNEVNAEQLSQEHLSSKVPKLKKVKPAIKKISPEVEPPKKDSDSTSDNTNVDTITDIDNKKNSFPKDKKHNGFLRNTNRRDKPKENTGTPHIHNNHNSNINNPNNKAHVKHIQHTASNGQNLSNTEVSNFPKENLNSPEYYLFSHLRQKTGNHPDKFWENLHLALKDKSFLDIKRADMTLVSYAALYEQIDIFEKLLNEYGKVIPQEEIETSIFKLSTNKNPLILKYTIDFYNTLYTASEVFIEGFLKIACKASYREEANKLLVNWLAPQMTDSNKKTFWHSCLENKNICFITLALNNKVLHNYLKDNQTQFESLIVHSGRQHTINNTLNTTIAEIAPLPPEMPSSVVSKIKKLKMLDSSPETNLLDVDVDTKVNGPEIIVKRKRKIG